MKVEDKVKRLLFVMFSVMLLTGVSASAAVSVNSESRRNYGTKYQTKTALSKEDHNSVETGRKGQSGSQSEAVRSAAFSFSDEDSTVTAVVPSDAGIPGDAEFHADRIEEGTPAYEFALASAKEGLDISEDESLIFDPYDIYFIVNGERIEPDNETIEIRFKNKSLSSAFSDDQNQIFGLHIKKDGHVERLNCETDNNGGFSFLVNSLSVMGMAFLNTEESEKKEDVSASAYINPVASGDNSGNLGDFLEDIEIRDEAGNLVEAKDFVPGGKYKVTLHFKEPDDHSKMFRPATKEELEEQGITEADLAEAGLTWQDILDGKYMFVELGDDISAYAEGGGADDGNVKVLKKGKYLLVRYTTDEYGFPMDDVTITFPVELSDDVQFGSVDVVVGNANGTYTPPGADNLFLNKQAVSYDPDTHSVQYKITIVNPTEEVVPGFTFDDTSSVKEASDVYPWLLGGTLMANGQPIEPTVSEEGHFSFTYPENIDPHSSLEITYTLDVSELVEKISGGSSQFLVENTATGTPLSEGMTEFSDDAEYQVELGYLRKSGYLRTEEDAETKFWGYDRLFHWDIELYDPYKALDQFVLTDSLTQNGIPVEPSIIAVSFYYNGNQVIGFIKGNPAGTNSPYGDFEMLMQMISYDENGNLLLDFSKAPSEIRDKLFLDGEHHHLKMSVLTQYEPGQAGHGYYLNTASGVLPSEIGERKASAHVNVGDPGVHNEKTGEVIDAGRKLSYTVSTNVGANISNDAWRGWGIGAGLIESLRTVEDLTSGTDQYGELDINEAVDVKSVTAVYQEGESEKRYEFIRDDNAINGSNPNKFGVYSVGEYGTEEYGCVGINEMHEVDYHTAIVINPTILEVSDPKNQIKSRWGYDVKQVFGTWPDVLDKQNVQLIVKYEIDPKKAYFINDSTHKKESYQGCETLFDYLSLKGDIIVRNIVFSAVRDSCSFDECFVDMTIPLSKKADLNLDVANGKKTISYTVTFQNGENNNASIPQTTQNLKFHDKFDERMSYCEGTLRASLYVSGELKAEYSYKNPESPCTGNELTALWSDFHDPSGETLQKAFNDQTAHYEIEFHYDLTPNEKMPMDDQSTIVRNEAWVSFDDQETIHVESGKEMPTGALTKQAVLENGKVTFYVEINEGKAQMSSTGGKLSIVDQFGDETYLKLDTDNINVQEFVEGRWVDLEKSTNPDGYEVTTEEGKLTIMVPDRKYLRIWYTYSLTDAGKQQENVEINNSVQILEKATLADGDKWSFSTSDVFASSSNHGASLSIKKVRQGTDQPVEGTKFILYSQNTGLGDTSAAEAEAERIGIRTLTNETFGKVAFSPVEVYTTQADGSTTVDWIYMKTGVPYALVESYAPDDYYSLKEPIYFKSENGEIQILSGNSDMISYEGEILTVENPAGGSLSVTKKVTGPGGDKQKDWHFTVTLSDTSINGVYGDDDTTGMTFVDGVAEFTLKDGETRTAKGLPADITYTVTEQEENQDNYQTTKENESGSIAVGTETKVTFTNEGKMVVTLPSTGGSGTGWIAGLSLLLILFGLLTFRNRVCIRTK